jgi:hypothetical protein
MKNQGIDYNNCFVSSFYICNQRISYAGQE